LKAAKGAVQNVDVQVDTVDLIIVATGSSLTLEQLWLKSPNKSVESIENEENPQERNGKLDSKSAYNWSIEALKQSLIFPYCQNFWSCFSDPAP
jgi:hypothetical protein